MSYLVDTCIWSEVLRKQGGDSALKERFSDLVRRGELLIIGPIRQEILSGIKSEAQFLVLERSLAAFPDEELLESDYVQAALFFNRCRRKGVQGSNTDFLICAVAARLDVAIYTRDRDFELFERSLPIQLWK